MQFGVGDMLIEVMSNPSREADGKPDALWGLRGRSLTRTPLVLVWPRAAATCRTSKPVQNPARACSPCAMGPAMCRRCSCNTSPNSILRPSAEARNYSFLRDMNPGRIVPPGRTGRNRIKIAACAKHDRRTDRALATTARSKTSSIERSFESGGYFLSPAAKHRDQRSRFCNPDGRSRRE